MGIYLEKGSLSFSAHDGCSFFYIRLKEKKSLKLEFSLNKSPKLFLSANRDEDRIKILLQILFFNLFITYNGLSRYIIKSEETSEWSISIFDWSLWWCLGRPIHSWSYHDWRHSNFSLINSILGKQKHSQDNRCENTHTLVLPEGEYLVEMVFEDFNTWRSRVPKFLWKRKTRRVDLTITPEIPYPGKNNPVSGYSHVSFPAKDVQEVTDHIYKEIMQKRKGDMSYYKNTYRKIVDNFMYTVNGLPINIGRVPIELHNKEWVPLGTSTSRIADETFEKLWDKDSHTPEEIGFINKYMGKSNSLDFIKDSSIEELHEEMRKYFKERNMFMSSGYSENNKAVPQQGILC